MSTVGLELVLNHSSGQLRGLTLPVAPNDERSPQVVEEGHQVAKDEGLQGLSSLEVDLNQEDHETIPLEPDGHPAIALVEEFSSLVSQVLGGMQDEETT